MKRILLLFVIGFSLLLTGCIGGPSDGGPSDAEIRSALEQWSRIDVKQHAARTGEKQAVPKTVSIKELKSKSVTKTENGEYAAKVTFTALIDNYTKAGNALVTMNKAGKEWKILTFEVLSNPLAHEDLIRKINEVMHVQMDVQDYVVVMASLSLWILALLFNLYRIKKNQRAGASKNSFIHRGKNVEFWQVTGEVLGSNKYSETHVSSSGGGGYVGQHGGHVSAPTIHSSTVTNHEFWIKTEDGLEKPIKLRGIDVPLRPGQKITLISAGRKEAGSGWYSILVNHSAGKHWFINSAEELNKMLKLELLTGKSLLIAGAIAWGVAYVTAPNHYRGKDWGDASWEIALGAAGIFIVYRLIIKISRVSSLTKKLKSHLENLAQLAYKNS